MIVLMKCCWYYFAAEEWATHTKIINTTGKPIQASFLRTQYQFIFYSIYVFSSAVFQKIFRICTLSGRLLYVSYERCLWIFLGGKWWIAVIGKEGGFAHVIEDETKFARSSSFIIDVLLGMQVPFAYPQLARFSLIFFTCHLKKGLDPRMFNRRKAREVA